MINTSSEGKPLQWRKSTRSALDRDCVEVARGPRGTAYLRDSKDVGGPVIAASPAAFVEFLSAVKNGVFDRRPSGGAGA